MGDTSWSEIYENYQNAHTFGEHWDWFWSLPGLFQIILGLGMFGLLAVLYIFIIAIFVDKEL